MAIDAATVRRVAHLARIKTPEDRLEPLAAELNGILAWIEQLNEVDVDGVTWVRYDGPDRAITLVQETPEVTTLVTTSTAPLADVETFIRRLAAE